jgi:NADPH:quinone reductase-like Zn-dependent oxidoreductase
MGLVYGGARHGSFQTYAACREVVVARVPNHIPLSQAVVLPLGLSTSITGLFDVLKLNSPSLETKNNGKTVLIWGGSSSMASVAIQLAAAAGYKVVTTASARNHEYAKNLGASEVFDYTDPDIENKLVESLSKQDLAGVFDCIGLESSTKACAKILSQLGGGMLPSVLFPPNGLPENVKSTIGMFKSRSCLHECH